MKILLEYYQKIIPDNAGIMHDFQNDDKASCYVNAVLKCSSHCHAYNKVSNCDNQLNNLRVL